MARTVLGRLVRANGSIHSPTSRLRSCPTHGAGADQPRREDPFARTGRPNGVTHEDDAKGDIGSIARFPELLEAVARALVPALFVDTSDAPRHTFKEGKSSLDAPVRDDITMRGTSLNG
jgi:hypothetical protein